MTSIDSAHGLAAIIRRQVSSLARTPGDSAAPTAGRAQRGANSPRRAATEASVDIAALVARRVQAIDRSDPNRHRKAFRVFLESVLLAELGANLINDAGFHQLVEDVHAQMDSDAELVTAMHSAATRMLAFPPEQQQP